MYFQAVQVPRNDVTLPNSTPTGSSIIFLSFAMDTNGDLVNVRLKDEFTIGVPANENNNLVKVTVNETVAEMPNTDTVCFFFYSFATAKPNTDDAAFYENMALKIDLDPANGGSATYLAVVNIEGEYPNCTKNEDEPCKNVDPELRYILPMEASTSM